MLSFYFLFPVFQTNYTSERERDGTPHKMGILRYWSLSINSINPFTGFLNWFEESDGVQILSTTIGLRVTFPLFPDIFRRRARLLMKPLLWSKLSDQESGLSESFSWPYFRVRKSVWTDTYINKHKCGGMRVSIGWWKVGPTDEFRKPRTLFRN